MKKSLILGCCVTGAKFTPKNHKLTGNRVYDSICSGDLIPVGFEDIENELDKLLQLGCRYWHIHARNPETREQSCDNDLYRVYGEIARRKNANLIVSYGGSRNGVEIRNTIAEKGEWHRISQASLSKPQGGADFVTFQAAIELQIACDLERQGFVEFNHENGEFIIKGDLRFYTPSDLVTDNGIKVHSTDNGGDYGKSSAVVQYETLLRCIRERAHLGLPYEVEWVQNARSRFLTWLIVGQIAQHVAHAGRLNITLLFGFSPKLPFPVTYRQFKRVVDQAKHIAKGHPNEDRIRVSVAVGVAVLPQHSISVTQPMDVGPLKGQTLTPLDRLIAYAMEPDSGVDVLRTGLEDTPYFQDENNTILPTTNVHLVKHAKQMIERLGGEIVIDRSTLTDFAISERKVAKAPKIDFIQQEVLA
ncbi:hypothetical protein [Pseudophaeobacter sp.]|uniref:hypothetical protein n=1 Tax=Pseudophaeobacter sp. TaxID=1971739 RepID=UPI00329963C5